MLYKKTLSQFAGSWHKYIKNVRKLDPHARHVMYACNESLEPKFTTITNASITNASVILIIRRQYRGNLSWLHIEILPKL